MNQFYVYESAKALSAMIPAESAAAAKADQITVDRFGYESGFVICKTGEASGSPSTQTITFQLKHGDESDGSDAADVAEAKLATSSAAITTDSTISFIPFRATQLKRYLTVAVTYAFTGGSTPKQIAEATFIFGNKYDEPVA